MRFHYDVGLGHAQDAQIEVRALCGRRHRAIQEARDLGRGGHHNRVLIFGAGVFGCGGRASEKETAFA